MRWSIPVLVVVLVLASVPAPASGSSSQPTVPIRYTVTPLDLEDSRYRIQARFSNLDGNIVDVTFNLAAYNVEFECVVGTLDVQGAPDATCGDSTVQVTMEDGQDTLTYQYEARLDKQAPRGGYNAVTTTDWAVLQASGIGFQFSYTFYQNNVPEFDPTLRFRDLPAGWSAEASFPKQDGTFQLEAAFPRPAGVVVLGSFTSGSCPVGTSDGVVVELADPRTDVCRTLQRTDDFLVDAFGDHIGPKVLAVVAPDPFKSGGVATRDGFAVHERVDAQTVVHEWIHIFQRFEACNRPQGQDCLRADDRTDTSGSTVWLKEGGAEYHSALAMYAAGMWTAQEVNEFLDRIGPGGRDYEGGRLDMATYANDVDAAYNKGALVLARIDTVLRNRTDRSLDLSTVLADLNRAKTTDLGPQDSLVETNDDFEGRLDRVDGIAYDWSAFFDRYVHGDEDPPDHTFTPFATFRVDALGTTPAQPIFGRDVTYRATVQNSGVEQDTETIRLFVDGVPVLNATVTLEPGATRELTVTRQAPAPGTHRLEAGASVHTFTVARPADLSVTDLQLEPDPPTARRDYAVLVTVSNAGDIAGHGQLRLVVDGSTAGTSTVNVTGQGQEVVRFSGVVSSAGPVNATVVLEAGGTTERSDASWQVERGGLFDLDDGLGPAIPGPGPILAAAAVVLAALAARRKV